MKNCTLLTLCSFLSVTLNSIFAQSRLDIIDSLIFGAKGTSKAIVLDNHQGDRREFVFDNNGKLVEDIQVWLSDIRKNDLERTLPNLVIDSMFYNDESTVDIYYRYLLEKKSDAYQTTLIKKDSSLVTEKTEVIKNGDSTILMEPSYSSKIQIKNIVVSKNGKYISYDRVYLSTDEPSTVYSWDIYYTEDKVFFIDLDFFTVYVLHYKNGIPIKLEYCYPTKRRPLSGADVARHYKKLPVEETTEIKYGENTSCLENTITGNRTMENFKKAHFMGY